MLNILQIIKKDLKGYYRESMTFKIVLFSPFLIIMVFGIIFSGGVPSTINLPVKIALCSLDENLPSGFIDSLQQEKWVRIEQLEGQSDCDKAVKDGISSGKYKGGIAIPEGFAAGVIVGNKTSMNVYVDNSLIGVEDVIKGYLWKVLQDYSQSFSDDPLSAVKAEFLDASLELKNISKSLSFSGPIESFRSDASAITSGLQGFDAATYQSQLQTTSTKIAGAQNQIDLTCSDIEDFRDDIQNYETELISIRAQLVDYDQQTVEARDLLQSLHESSCFSDVPMFTDMMDACDQIEDSIQELDQTHLELQQRIGEIDTLLIELNQADALLESRQNALLAMKNDIAFTQASISNLEDDISYLASIKEDADSLEIQVDSYSAQAEYEEKNVKSKMDGFSDKVNEMLMGMSSLPLSPIEVETRNTFENLSFLDFIMPSLITLLVMFTSLFISCTTIIAERDSGTLIRNLLTPVSLFSFIAGKIASVVLVGLAEISVIVAIGFLAFNIFVPGMVLELALFIVISMLAFSVIGMFIGIWSNSGITAVLISITIMIVLLFISGITVPNEMLPEAVVEIGGMFPLANVFSLIKGLFVYNTVNSGAFTYLVIVSIIFLVASIISIKLKIR